MANTAGKRQVLQGVALPGTVRAFVFTASTAGMRRAHGLDNTCSRCGGGIDLGASAVSRNRGSHRSAIYHRVCAEAVGIVPPPSITGKRTAGGGTA